MALQMRETKTLKVSLTSAENVKLFDNTDDPKAVRINGELTQENDGTIQVAAVSNKNVPVGDVTLVKGFHFQADGDFNISVDGGAAFLVEARTGSDGVAVALFGGDIAPTTSINIANPSTTAVLTGRFVIVGDPTT